jgi:hypothetical protein
MNAAVAKGESGPGQSGQIAPVTFCPDLVITESATGFSVCLALPDGAECPPGQSAALALSIRSALSDDVLSGHETVRISLTDADAVEIAAASALIGRLDTVLKSARSDSDDSSLAHTVQTLAAHYKVRRIVLIGPDKSETEIRRGESYIKAHRMVESFMARNAKAA